MPPFKEIESLNSICNEWVWRWLYYCLKHGASPQDRMKQREYVVMTLNSNIRQQLLNHVCRAHMNKVDIASKCFLIELLGDKSTQCVDISESGTSYVDGIYLLYRTLTFGLLLNLTRLGMKCNVKSLNDRRHVPDLNVTFYRVFNQMHNLRWLTLQGLADRTIMGLLGNNCHHLEYLDVSSSPLLNDEGIARLVLRDPAIIFGRSFEQVSRLELDTTELSKKLCYVSVHGSDVTMMGATILVGFLPKLRSLGGGLDCGNVALIIRLFQPDNDTRRFHFQDWNDSVITPDAASLVCDACPEIRNFIIRANCIDSLLNFHPLLSLTIEDLQYDPLPLYNYLEIKGSSLKELILDDNINCPLDLWWIMEYMPNLERLHSKLIVTEGYELPDWKKLKTAHIMISSSKLLLTLLAHTPDIRELSIRFYPDPYSESYDCLNDDLFIYIALSDGLKKLEKLIIRDCALSSRGIDCLLIHCPELCYIGTLSYWYNVTQDDIKRLRLEAIQNNWKLKLVLLNDWEGEVNVP